jgi:hypothetical protein
MPRTLDHPREEARQPVRLHPDHVADREPRIDDTYQHEAGLAQNGAGVFHELVRTIRRTLPLVSEEKARHTAHEIMALAARTSGRGRRD